MEQSYSIDEILSAVDEIRNIKKKEKNLVIKDKFILKKNSSVPDNTLKIIEEAEKKII